MKKMALRSAPRNLTCLLSQVKAGARAVIIGTGAQEPPLQDDPNARAVVIDLG